MGVTLVDLPKLEALFQTNVECVETQALVPKLRSSASLKNTLSVLFFKNHFMYISDINIACHAFVCLRCIKLWNVYNQLHRNEKLWQGIVTKDVYTGGVYNIPQTIWEELSSLGITVDPVYIYPYRVTFDYKRYFSDADLPNVKGNMVTTQSQQIYHPKSGWLRWEMHSRKLT